MHWIRLIMMFSEKNLNIMVFSSESCLGLGLIYPIASNSAGLMVLTQMSGKYKWVSHRGHASSMVLFYSSSISMIFPKPFNIPLRLCMQSRDLTQLNEAINTDLKKLETWLQGNKLSLNVAKTHSMLISTKQKGSSLRSRNGALELKIRDNELVVVQKTKYLGVHIDCSLDWKVQINAVATKVSWRLAF